jgi:divalent metal cation (Fe/Co/Zn/Cd) transporter
MDILLVATGRNDVSELELAEYLFPSLDKITTIIVTALIAFVSMFIISYIFDYIVGEKFKVARYNKMISQLDEEDEE